MAFTTRSQRQTSFIPQHTFDTPGPGQFNVPSSDFDRRPHYALAPFSSTSRRQIGENQEEKPGPGHYFRSKNSSHSRRDPTSNFKSQTERFNSSRRAQSSVPAPGDYHKPMEWVKSKRRKSTGKKNDAGIVWVKVSTAPSIPDREQSHGYEEGPSGELIRQRAPVRGYKGTKEDMVGPTDYTYSTEARSTWDKTKGKSAFKSTTKRGIFDVKNDTPAPGEYHPDERKKDDNPFAEPPVQSSSFASKTKRTEFTSTSADKTIGPGSYIDPYRHGSTFKKSKIPERYQNFGSSSIRSTTNDSIGVQQKELLPGPGHFVKETNTIGRSQLFPRNMRGPFGSTSERFTNKKADIATAPGQYETNSFVDDVHKRVKVGAYGVFGSTSRRFNKMQSNAPGVGSYNPALPEKGQYKRNDPRSSVFASKTKRDALTDKNAKKAPAPGEYHQPSQWVRKNGTRLQGEFGTRDRRFRDGLVPKSAVENPNLAPGRYQDFGAYCRTKNKKNFSTKLTSFSTSPRFDAPKSKKRWYDNVEPAPGSYHVDSGWNKRTFNVSIAEGTSGS